MRNTFRGYYPPTDEELEKLWTDGLIVLDTNALLNLFRYSVDAREDFFKALQLKADSLWIPHQVGLEFHRRRIEVVNNQGKAFSEVEDALTKAQNIVQSSLNSYKRHPSLETQPLIDTLSDTIEGLRAKLKEARQQHDEAIASGDAIQATFTQITDLYEGRVGPEFAAERLSDIYKKGSARYEKEIPPGYKDRQKGEPARYGDLVLWEQLLDHARTAKRPAIFVTDDQKEDWWYIIDSQTYGPRPELVAEYFDAAGERIHFMTPNRFLDFAKARTQGIRSESVSEVEAVSRALEENKLYWSRSAVEQAIRDHRLHFPMSDPTTPLRPWVNEAILIERFHQLRMQIDELVARRSDIEQRIASFEDWGETPHLLDLKERQRAISIELEKKFAEFEEIDNRRREVRGREYDRHIASNEDADRRPRAMGEGLAEYFDTHRPDAENELRSPDDEGKL